MEINITKFVNSCDMKTYSASIAEMGNPNIGTKTWKAAQSIKRHKFVTEANKQEFVDYFNEFGAWDDLDKWSINQLNALFVQFLASEWREVEACDGWEDYLIQYQNGRVSGDFFKDDETGQIYFILAH